MFLSPVCSYVLHSFSRNGVKNLPAARCNCTHTPTHRDARTHTHRSWSVFLHDCFALELTGECLKCSFRLTRGGPCLRGVIGSTVGAYPRGTGSNRIIPSRAMGTFFPHTVSSIFRLSLIHTHTHARTHARTHNPSPKVDLDSLSKAFAKYYAGDKYAEYSQPFNPIPTRLLEGGGGGGGSKNQGRGDIDLPVSFSFCAKLIICLRVFFEPYLQLCSSFLLEKWSQDLAGCTLRAYTHAT